ncbi:PQQ-binding-like beta-propeller repeat protein [Streptomyces sp. XD-27]|uniref:serine/threonine-protein kinase n=1 Tax=Streptomyces sp. XD-27 TaxID=3062779 RepID=UPI0026F42705|nr:serine/threonine-protein kinase [Streptomyces sp. XD-27]WKX71233.1 protein kinase [Streptomyces sp. XD-27]
MFGPPQDRAPRVVGPYQLIARLGAGGMGEVFLGIDQRQAVYGGSVRAAAVKTIRPELGTDGDFRNRFRREIEAARAVDSRCTARLLGGDADAVSPWMATEYVPGPTLDKAVRVGGPLPPEAVRHLALDLVRALRTIHHARILHRDLKPGNVLLAADHAKVIDFGIARAFGAGTMTATGMMIGSPGFMSPEHVAGSRHVVAASDAFSLASLLCYAATGEGVFGDGPVAAVLYRISQAEADLSRVPGWLREVVADCLHADPSARPDTAELERRLGGPAVAADRPSAPWPEPVRALIAERERELQQLIAAGAGAVPVTPPVPTMPGASPIHSAPTVHGAPPRPYPLPQVAAAGPGPDRRRFSRRLVVIGAGALAVGLLAALGIRALKPGPEGDGGGGGASGGATKPGAADSGSSYVDELGGPDRNRVFAAGSSQRPPTWREWSAKLADKPVDCALDTRVLVCRLVDGSLQAVNSANGARMWHAPQDDPGQKPSYSARGTLNIPGSGSNPVIQGDLVLSAESGRLRARAVKDGAVRWDKPQTAYSGQEGKIVAAEGRVFLTSFENDGSTRALAYDADSGRRLWTRKVAAHSGSEASRIPFTVQAYGTGLVYVLGEHGLTARDARTGDEAAVSDLPPEQCLGAQLSGGEVLCPGKGEGPVVLDARSLDRVDNPRDPRYPGVSADSGALGAIAGEGALTTDMARQQVVLHTQMGEERVVGPVASAPDGAPAPVSSPVFAGRTALYADNAALYELPPDGAKASRIPVAGAPGIRSAPGIRDVSKAVWAPELLSVGGLVFLAYHDGTVRSLELPRNG